MTPTWEYATVAALFGSIEGRTYQHGWEASDTKTPDSLDAHLARLGVDGWEVCASGQHRVMLKRRKRYNSGMSDVAAFTPEYIRHLARQRDLVRYGPNPRAVILRGGPWDRRVVEINPGEERYEVVVRSASKGEPSWSPNAQTFHFWYAPTADPEVWAVTEDSPLCEVREAIDA